MDKQKKVYGFEWTRFGQSIHLIEIESASEESATKRARRLTKSMGFKKDRGDVLDALGERVEP